MIPVDRAITNFRRHLTVASVTRGLLIAGAVAGVVIRMLPLNGASLTGNGLLLAVVAIWLVLFQRSARGSRLAADSPSLIAAGRFAEAEEHIQSVLSQFSIFKTAKFLGLHHLAMLRHAEKRYRESAALCHTLLMHRLGTVRGISKPTRLIMADALLETGDLVGAHRAITALYSERLSLGEALNLQVIQADYLSRIGAWELIVQGLPGKVQMCELMPQQVSARSQAILALACQKRGMTQWAEYLKRRAELLVDVQRLCTDRPMLWELWRTTDADSTSLPPTSFPSTGQDS